MLAILSERGDLYKVVSFDRKIVGDGWADDISDGRVWVKFEDSQSYQEEQLARLLARIIEYWLEEDDGNLILH